MAKYHEIFSCFEQAANFARRQAKSAKASVGLRYRSQTADWIVHYTMVREKVVRCSPASANEELQYDYDRSNGPERVNRSRPNSFAYAAPIEDDPDMLQRDWSEFFDDADSRDWEWLMGGPEDSYFDV